VAVCFFTSDLHGRRDRYEKLFDRILAENPYGVFLGGDLMPHVMDSSWRDAGIETHLVDGFLAPGFRALKAKMGADYPHVFTILGNDDPYSFVAEMVDGQEEGLWSYVHGRSEVFGDFRVYGYNCVPPTPFQLKDWERYDVSRFVDPGCIAPDEGTRTDGMTGREVRLATIRGELAETVGDDDLSSAILLFHSPPYRTALDRADLDGKFVDHAPLDPHVGSIAIKEFIEDRQPVLSLHGHVHETAILTGKWKEQLGTTWAFGGAHSGPELPLVRFNPEEPGTADRELI
jgi:uncharacterized protein